MKQELKIKEGIKVFTDKKTNAKTIALPLRLPDGTSAIVMISRLKGEDWKPEDEIKNIIINFKK